MDDTLQIQKIRAELKKRTGELEAAHKELAALIYSVSHDLRAPLRIIDGFTDALAQEYEGALDERGVGYLRHVRGAAERMDLLINKLVQLSRISNAELHREPVDLSEMARSIAAELIRSDPSRNVDFHIPGGLTIEGDPSLLKVAFQHLLGNAWKFTSRHPAALIELGTEQRDGQRLLYVRDDGAGFDPTYAGKMFAPFQRFHAETEFEGTGMGLAIVQRIIHRHGGKVWAVGKVEQGTTIYMALE